jgi:hypothetical protein
MATSTLFDLGGTSEFPVDAVETVTRVFAGSDYQAERDGQRLATQIGCILLVVMDGNWWTVTRLSMKLRGLYPAIQFPENSVQAQLRNLRKLGYTVEKRNAAERGVCYEYRVLPKNNPGVGPVVQGVPA